ncbi:MAG: MotA/TolQ/ExbB proton channel family protein [Humidesulfovibrio sp.]|uniref:MotA/TolQ/ExbB proton channel family protein n=1 Tax=Humidesulfovibrio sp. TaxID=2910988 RepID=UPI0027351D78|nr:MotA/TolQ/ExbB proton channel family protein [Humidesulfovibrio sp.]MDP2846985.1 MotA/TolQ/ExbB proton channel family protein [Humidesulfovibrio sp.]
MIPDSGFWGLMLGATLGVQVVLVFLAGMSLWSWTIIFHKIFLYNRIKGQVGRGYALFNDAADLSEGLSAISREEGSPLSRVGLLAVGEFRKLEKADIERDRKRMLVKDTLRRVLRQGVSEEMKHLSSSLSFLATCANAAPFIGLFGTVWGIMHAFHSIGQSQSAALAVVAPGISEALVTTAIGLVVAIPATIAYNYLLSMLGDVETEMVNFAGAFLNRVEREVSWASGAGSRNQ